MKTENSRRVAKSRPVCMDFNAAGRDFRYLFKLGKVEFSYLIGSLITLMCQGFSLGPFFSLSPKN